MGTSLSSVQSPSVRYALAAGCFEAWAGSFRPFPLPVRLTPGSLTSYQLPCNVSVHAALPPPSGPAAGLVPAEAEAGGGSVQLLRHGGRAGDAVCRQPQLHGAIKQAGP